jgi:hypothetical protein
MNYKILVKNLIAVCFFSIQYQYSRVNNPVKEKQNVIYKLTYGI